MSLKDKKKTINNKVSKDDINLNYLRMSIEDKNMLNDRNDNNHQTYNNYDEE